MSKDQCGAGPTKRNDTVGESSELDVVRAREELWRWRADKYRTIDFTRSPEEAESRKKAAAPEEYQH
jgi:hypothetical protein